MICISTCTKKSCLCALCEAVCWTSNNLFTRSHYVDSSSVKDKDNCLLKKSDYNLSFVKMPNMTFMFT